MAERVTVVLPVEADAPVSAGRAAALADLAGARIGVVDNGLWRAMPTIVDTLATALAERGAGPIEVLPFDHLAPDFADQLAALGPFGRRVDGVVSGLGN